MTTSSGARRLRIAGPATPARSTGSVSGPSILRTRAAVPTARRRRVAGRWSAVDRRRPKRPPRRHRRYRRRPARLQRAGGVTRVRIAPCLSSGVGLAVGARRAVGPLVVEHRVEVAGELRHQLLRDVAEDPASELGDPAGDVQIGGDDAAGAGGREALRLGGDLGGGVALPAGVAPLGLEHGAVPWVIAVDERRLALERRGDRAELDLDDPDRRRPRSPRAGRRAGTAIFSTSVITAQASSIGRLTVNSLTSCSAIGAGPPRCRCQRLIRRTVSQRRDRVEGASPPWPLRRLPSGAAARAPPAAAPVAAHAGVGGHGERGVGGGDRTPRLGDERLVAEGDHRPLRPEFGAAGQPSLERGGRAPPPFGVDDLDDAVGQVARTRSPSAGTTTSTGPIPLASAASSARRSRLRPSISASSLCAPTEAAALAGGEDDGDGGLAHVPSLPAEVRCARRHVRAVDRVTGCLRNDVV